MLAGERDYGQDGRMAAYEVDASPAKVTVSGLMDAGPGRMLDTFLSADLDVSFEIDAALNRHREQLMLTDDTGMNGGPGALPRKSPLDDRSGDRCTRQGHRAEMPGTIPLSEPPAIQRQELPLMRKMPTG